MNNETTEHFEPFPTARVQQIEARAKPTVPVVNPHHPDPAKRGLPAAPPNPRIPPGGRAAAAQGMTIAAPGTPAPQRQPFRPPMPEAAPMHAQAYSAEPLPVTPNSIEEAVSFALPSNFLYYDFKDLYIQPFKGRHFSKLHRAREEASMLHVVEAVSSVLSSPSMPGVPGLAFMLTLPDFYACLYWLRMHSFLKHGFTHQTMCRNVEHQERVNKGELLPDTLKHAQTISKASLKTKMLEAVPNPDDFVLEYPGLRLSPATMRDVLDITMNDNIDQFAARLAASFRFEGYDVPLFERMKIVDDLSGDDIATIQAFEQASSDYGVEESIRWVCKHCGHAHTDPIELEAHSFFPSAA